MGAVSIGKAILRSLPGPIAEPLSSLSTRFRWVRKYKIVRGYQTGRKSIWAKGKYVLLDPELSNFTYRIGNEGELAEWLAESVGTDVGLIEGYLSEYHADRQFHGLLGKRLRRRWDRKLVMHAGRRVGWYAIARHLKPKLIVETGIHDGLGSAILLNALRRNESEGQGGQLISIDVDPNAGWLVPGELRKNWTPVFASTFDVLPDLLADKKVGMIVHDSDHTYECEEFEFLTAIDRASPTLALVSDNSHATSALSDVCEKLGIRYQLFRERPIGHFYPGAAIGLGVLRSDSGDPVDPLNSRGSR